MKILRYLIFLSILSGIFFVIYRQSDENGFRRWWISFKIAVLIALQQVPESALAKEFNQFQGTDQQVILVGRDSSGTSSNVPSNIGRQRVLPDQVGKVDSMRGGFSADSIKRSYRHIPDLPVGQGIQKVTGWSVAKHIHHAPKFGLNPNKYGMTQADLDSIAQNGLINHINQGGMRPSEEFVKDLQMVWKVFAEDKNSTCLNNQKVMGKKCTVFKNMKTGHFVAFDSQTGESFTAYRLTEKQSIRHDETDTIGQDYNHKT